MKHKYLCLVLTTSAVLVGCGEASVPQVSDPHNVVVDGKAMTGPEFIAKYCGGQPADKTCDAVRTAVSQDAGHRPLAKGW